MPTKAEIARWVRPYLNDRDDAVLVRRSLFLKPIDHLARGMYFLSSRSRAWPQIAWFVELLFSVPGSWNSRFERIVTVASTEEESFESDLRQTIQGSFDVLRPLRSIEECYDFALSYENFTFQQLGWYPLDRGVTLAAMGRLDEARAVLEPAIAEREVRALAQLREGEALIAKRKNHGAGGVMVRFASGDLALVAKLKPLLTLIEAKHRLAIAGLLREWELENATQWGIEHLWEPTPFPIETAV